MFGCIFYICTTYCFSSKENNELKCLITFIVEIHDLSNWGGGTRSPFSFENRTYVYITCFLFLLTKTTTNFLFSRPSQDILSSENRYVRQHRQSLPIRVFNANFKQQDSDRIVNFVDFSCQVFLLTWRCEMNEENSVIPTVFPEFQAMPLFMPDIVSSRTAGWLVCDGEKIDTHDFLNKLCCANNFITEVTFVFCQYRVVYPAYHSV